MKARERLGLGAVSERVFGELLFKCMTFVLRSKGCEDHKQEFLQAARRASPKAPRT